MESAHEERSAWWAERDTEEGVHQQQDWGALQAGEGAVELSCPLRGWGRPHRVQGVARSQGSGTAGEVGVVVVKQRTWPAGSYDQRPPVAHTTKRVVCRVFQMQRVPLGVMRGTDGMLWGDHWRSLAFKW